jgi:hypothetical protein
MLSKLTTVTVANATVTVTGAAQLQPPLPIAFPLLPLPPLGNPFAAMEGLGEATLTVMYLVMVEEDVIVVVGPLWGPAPAAPAAPV